MKNKRRVVCAVVAGFMALLLLGGVFYTIIANASMWF